jgi:hypothetical protein
MRKTHTVNLYDSLSQVSWVSPSSLSVFLSFPSPSVSSPLSPSAGAHAKQHGAAGVPLIVRLCCSLHCRSVSCFELYRFSRVIWRGEFQCSQVVITGPHDWHPLLDRSQYLASENLFPVVRRPHPSHPAWVPFACPCHQRLADRFEFLRCFYCSLDSAAPLNG